MCVERVHNLTIMDEEFQALYEYVEHKLLVKTITLYCEGANASVSLTS